MERRVNTRPTRQAGSLTKRVCVPTSSPLPSPSYTVSNPPSNPRTPHHNPARKRAFCTSIPSRQCCSPLRSPQSHNPSTPPLPSSPPHPTNGTLTLAILAAHPPHSPTPRAETTDKHPSSLLPLAPAESAPMDGCAPSRIVGYARDTPALAGRIPR